MMLFHPSGVGQLASGDKRRCSKQGRMRLAVFQYRLQMSDESAIESGDVFEVDQTSAIVL